MKRIGWVGFSDSKPLFAGCNDIYGYAEVSELFKIRSAARRRYKDVRAVYMSSRRKPAHKCGRKR